MNPWMQAHESRMATLETLRRLDEAPRSHRGAMAFKAFNWDADIRLLMRATPFAWGTSSIDAVEQAAKTIPLDTVLHQWNLDTRDAWWHFERLLDVKTTTTATTVRAFALAWVNDTFVLSVWVTDNLLGTPGLIPSQVWCWLRGETLGDMLTRVEQEHRALYGPGGPKHAEQHIPSELVWDITKTLSTFVLAGLAWMDQRILTNTEAPVERHARKRYQRETGKNPSPVRVIQLRRTQPHHDEPSDSQSGTKAWQHQWIVAGHWRHQACGPKHGERKLTFVSSYLKGPEDKPLKPVATKVYEVNR